MANALGYNVVSIAVEAHRSFIAEKYHDPLRSIANKLIVKHSTALLQLISDHANLDLSHTIKPEEFTPAILAFCAQPCLPIENYERQSQSSVNSMDLMNITRCEFEALVSGRRVKNEINTASPSKVVVDITPEDEVFVYGEERRDEMDRTHLSILMVDSPW